MSKGEAKPQLWTAGVHVQIWALRHLKTNGQTSANTINPKPLPFFAQACTYPPGSQSRRTRGRNSKHPYPKP